MGVSGLWRLLLPIGRRISIETLEGKVIAVDASIWLTQFLKAMRDPDSGSVRPAAHIIGFFRRLCRLRFHGIRPIFVFDGATPEIKLREIQQRRKRREQFAAMHGASTIQRMAKQILVQQLKKKKVGTISSSTGNSNAASYAPGFQPLEVVVEEEGDKATVDIIEKDGTEEKTNDETEDATRNTSETNLNSSQEQSTEQKLLQGGQEEIENERQDVMPSLELESDWDKPILPCEEQQSVRLSRNYNNKREDSENSASSDNDEGNGFIVRADEDNREDDDENDFDINRIASLLPSERKDAIEDAKRMQRLRSRREFMPVAANPVDYSQAQVRNFLRSSRLNQSIERMAIQTSRNDNNGEGEVMASDRTRRVLFEKDVIAGNRTMKNTYANKRWGGRQQRQRGRSLHASSWKRNKQHKPTRKSNLIDTAGKSNRRRVLYTSSSDSDSSAESGGDSVPDSSDHPSSMDRTGRHKNDAVVAQEIADSILAGAIQELDDDDVGPSVSQKMELASTVRSSSSSTKPTNAWLGVKIDMASEKNKQRRTEQDYEEDQDFAWENGDENETGISSEGGKHNVHPTNSYSKVSQQEGGKLIKLDSGRRNDGGSTDGTTEVIKKTSRDRRKVIDDDNGCGPCSNNDVTVAALKQAESTASNLTNWAGRAVRRAISEHMKNSNDIAVSVAEGGSKGKNKMKVKQKSNLVDLTPDDDVDLDRPTETHNNFGLAKITQSMAHDDKKGADSGEDVSKEGDDSIDWESGDETEDHEGVDTVAAVSGETRTNSPQNVSVKSDGNRTQAQSIDGFGGHLYSQEVKEQTPDDVAHTKEVSTNDRMDPDDAIEGKGNKTTVVTQKENLESPGFFEDDDVDWESCDEKPAPVSQRKDDIPSTQSYEADDCNVQWESGDEIDNKERGGDNTHKGDFVFTDCKKKQLGVVTDQRSTASPIRNNTAAALKQAEATAANLTNWAGRAVRQAIAQHVESTAVGISHDPIIITSTENKEESSPTTSVFFSTSTSVVEEGAKETNSYDNNFPNNYEPIATSDDVVTKLDEDLSEDFQGQQQLERDMDTVTDEMREEAMQLLQLFGIPYIEAPAEAEAQCVTLEKLGLVNGIVTEDSDVFVFGGKTVYKNIFDEQKYVEVYLAEDAEKELGLGRNEMVALAMLLGGDYTSGIKGVGIVNGMEILEAFDVSQDLRDGLKKFRTWLDGFDPADAVINTSTTSPTSGVLTREKVFHMKHRSARSRWIAPENFPAENVISAYTKPVVDTSTDRFSWGIPDIENLVRFCNRHIGWRPEDTQAMLEPVVKKVQNGSRQTRIDSFMRYEHGIKFANVRSKRLREVIQTAQNENRDAKLKIARASAEVDGKKRKKKLKNR